MSASTLRKVSHRGSSSASKSAAKTRGRPFEKGNKLGKGRPQGSRNKVTLAVDDLLNGEAEALTRKAIEMPTHRTYVAIAAAGFVLSSPMPAMGRRRTSLGARRLG